MAAVLTQQSELITHQVAAVPLPNSRAFTTIRDENGNPLIFSIGTNGVFYAFKENDFGARVMINLNDAFGLPDGTEVASFAVKQDAEDTIYLAFAHVRLGDDEKKKKKTTPLIVTIPFSPNELDVDEDNGDDEDEEEIDLRHLIMPEQGGTVTAIQKVYMGPKSKRVAYPEIYLGYKPLNEVHKSADIARVRVARDYNHWCVANDLELPENADQIVDFCPAFLRIGSGFFLLYVIQGETQLLFSTTRDDDGFLFQVAMVCPQGARCLATSTDEYGYSSVLVGGQGLWYWSTDDALKRATPGRLLSNDEGFERVTELLVAQNSTTTSVFASNADEGLSYTTTTSLDFSEALEVVPLIPEGQAGTFSPFLPSNSKTQHLIATTPRATELTLLQQDLQTGVWKNRPLFLPALEENIEFDAYMTRISIVKPRSDEKKGMIPVLTEDFILECPQGWTDLFVNGRSVMVGPDGAKVQTDHTGSFTLIVPTDDISSFQFRLLHQELIPEGYDIDPMAKTHRKLAALNSGDDLRNAKTSEGKPLLEGTELSDDEIDELGGAMKGVNDARPNLKKREANEYDDDDDDDDVGDKDIKVVAGKKVKRGGKKKINLVKAARHWFRKTFPRLAGWWIQVRNGVYKAFVQIGEAIYNFVLEVVQDIADFFTMVWEKIADAWDKFVEFIKFLFNWKDIIAFKDGIVRRVNRGLDAAVSCISRLEPKTEAVFDSISDMVGAFVYPDVLDDLKVDPDDPETPQGLEKPETHEDAQASQNYTDYQITHGGSMGRSVPKTRKEAKRNDKKALRKLEVPDELEPMLEGFESMGQRFADTFSAGYLRNGKVSAGEMARIVIGDLLLGIIDIAKGAAVTMIRVVATGIELIKKLLNFEWKIPVLSALYRKLTGNTLTILDATCLVAAIPATILTKVICKAKGIKWAPLKDRDLSKEATEMLNKSSDSDFRLFASVVPEDSGQGQGESGDEEEDDEEEVERSTIVSNGINLTCRVFRTLLKALEWLTDPSGARAKLGETTSADAAVETIEAGGIPAGVSFINVIEKLLGVVVLALTFPQGETSTARVLTWTISAQGTMIDFLMAIHVLKGGVKYIGGGYLCFWLSWIIELVAISISFTDRESNFYSEIKQGDNLVSGASMVVLAAAAFAQITWYIVKSTPPPGDIPFVIAAVVLETMDNATRALTLASGKGLALVTMVGE